LMMQIKCIKLIKKNNRKETRDDLCIGNSNEAFPNDKFILIKETFIEIIKP